MSITAYTGLPGHGKSYGVVEHVLVPAAKEFRTIYTNIPLNTELFLERFGIAPIAFDIDEIRDNPSWFDTEFQPGAIFVIDECWRLWPAGTNANRLEESHKAFFAEHRHLVGDDGRSTEIVLVTQDLAQIASFMRNLVETTFRVTKLSKVGASKLFRVDVYSGAVTGPNPPQARREREIPGKFKKDIYQLYKSHTKSEVGAGNESRADARFNVLGGFKVKGFFIVLFLLVLFIYWGSGSLMTSFGKNPVDAAPSSPVLIDPDLSITEYPPQVVDSEDLIKAADRVYIAYNNGRFPAVEYLFRIVSGEGFADVDAAALITLGYEVQPISQCLVTISKNRRSHTAVCEPALNEKKDFISNLAASNNSNNGR